jgi:nucleotide-binding universal stress UspA family protein
MSERESGFTLRRILVALDASAHSLAALEAAAELAAAMQAEMEGLFVEDINLIRLASLPCTREVRHTASLASLDLEQMERALKAQAAEARQALAAAARRARVQWSFRVTRGHVAHEVLAAAAAADLVTLGKQGRSRSRQARLGSTALRALAGAPVALLLVEHRRVGAHGPRFGKAFGAGIEARRSVLVVCDGSEGAGRALDAAARLAEAGEVPLTVLLLADDSEAARDLQLAAADSLEGRPIEVRWRYLAQVEGGNLARAIQSDEAVLVVLSLASPRLPAASVSKLLDHITNPVLLIR